MRPAALPCRSAGEVARLVTGRRLRGMMLALRHDIQQYDPPTSPDEKLIGLTVSPFVSIDDAFDRLRRLETVLVSQRDRRSIFLTIYTRMTQRIRALIDRGGFSNPTWMRAYTTTFANYYRRAFLAFERGDLGAVPDPWRIAFGTALRGDALVLQDAVLGINAHINYDLALTLRDVGIDPNRPEKRDDHQAVNEVLARLVDAQQTALAEIYAAGIEHLDVTLGRLDERVALFGLTEGRKQAWRVATVLADVGWPPIRSVTRWALRATATGGAAFVRSPSLDPTVFTQLRRFEQEGLQIDELLETLQRRLNEMD